MAHRSRRWFYPSLSSLQATDLLLNHGAHGSFLVRPSESNPRNFVMCIRQGVNELHNIRIENTGDFFQFDQTPEESDEFELEQFPSLEDLVDYYEKDGEVVIVMDSGATVHLQLKEAVPNNDHSSYSWYHGILDDGLAEDKIRSVNQDGVFLVYCSPTPEPNEYHLIATWSKQVNRFFIRKENNQYTLNGEEMFPSLPDLIEHHYSNAMPTRKGGQTMEVFLKQPYRFTEFVIRNIGEHLTKMREKKSGSSRSFLEDEFEYLQSCSPYHCSSEGQRKENKSKNRYKNILPYDHCRVVLQGMPTDEVGSDYINASIATITKFGVNKKYIVAQGCLLSTENAFWHMVWQERCEVIVMTTALVEGGKIKCMKYWPNHTWTMEYGNLHVTCDEESETEYSYVRRFTVRNASLKRHVSLMNPAKMKQKMKDSRTVFQFQFKSWPDHSVPREPNSVLQFLRDIRQLQSHQLGRHDAKHDSGPMLLHCSAGIGRSGVMVALDILIDTVNLYDPSYEISIQEVIRYLRDFRTGLIQSYQQYAFLYEALAKYIEGSMKGIKW